MRKRNDDIFPSKDPVKKALFIPKILLESTNLWPEKRTPFAKITNWIFLFLCIFIESGQIAFVIRNIKDITRIASAMSTVSTTFQAITKLSVLYIYSNKLKSVLWLIWHEFWPAEIAGPRIEQQLKSYNTIIIHASVVMFISGVSFAFGFLSAPLRTGTRILPFESVYPFDWSGSPLYEIIYVTEWITNIAFIVVGICGHDYLFLGICSNIVAQYTLLRATFNSLGAANIEETNRRILDSNTEPLKRRENEKLLERCIAHHVMLTDVCEEVAHIFSFSCFVQLFSSVTALCVAALIMTFAEIDVTLFTAVSAYLFGHLLQLFLFCTLGNEVTSHAGELATSIFCSEWYNIEGISLKKDLLFVMDKARREVKISALGILALNYETFIGVLKLSFSFYTMLSKASGHK
ncbi:7tm 6 domain containing protein [Asbolus verrucosus]|uniref:Odorant receptor n=1 Tax=Asbolus verrucosus TaxID=1661398 RepID=A0A482V944_ASBVE|nr:7tm 6 domain containing protein [Asbolus verrucosus]